PNPVVPKVVVPDPVVVVKNGISASHPSVAAAAGGSSAATPIAVQLNATIQGGAFSCKLPAIHLALTRVAGPL
ncbi:MAG TPA: hypothetical protein VJY39_03540, partial [Acidisphaera sp.]|nr:hypothetical protein [Acidisphaera sp.]